MFLMIYYICLFWVNEGEKNQLYMNITQLDDSLKYKFINSMIENHGGLSYIMDKAATLACDDPDYYMNKRVININPSLIID